MPTNKNKQHCQSLTAAGQPCRAWAQPGSNPPRCNVHGPRALPATRDRRGSKSRACTAITASGAPCRAWAMHNHHLCSVHARRTIPHPTKHQERRCQALTKNGQPCHAWARRDSHPLRCNMHSGNTQPGANPDHQRRRCQALTRHGRPCRNWATRHRGSKNRARGSKNRACAAHAGQYTLRAPGKHRCSAATAAGQPCPHWVVPRTEALYGVRLCRVHLPASDPRRVAMRLPRRHERRCAAKTLDGKQCRHWTLPHDHAQGLCWLHANPHQHPKIRHSYYRRIPHFTPAAHAHIARLARERNPLAAALLVVRLKLQNLAAYLTRRDLHNRARLAATKLLYRGVNAVARLLHARPAHRPQIDHNAARLLYRITSQQSP